MLAALLTTFLFSISAVTGRRLADHVSATQANLSRLLFSAVLLGAWSHLFGFGIGGIAFPILFASGCVGFGLGDLALFQAYPRIGARRTMVLVQCLAAPFGALMEWAWLGHAPTAAQAAFGAVVLIGIGIALMPRKDEAQPLHGLWIGIFFGVLSAFGQGGGAVISRKAYEVASDAGAPLKGIHDGVNAAYQRMLGGIFVSVLFFLYLKLAHKSFAERKGDWTKAWPWLIGNSLFGPCFGVACFQWALMTEKTSIVLPIVATTPLAVMPLAHFMEGDRITWRTVLGGVIAVAGVIGLTLAK